MWCAQWQCNRLTKVQCGQVDVIVSEWMGYALFFEAMLDSVLHARDRCALLSLVLLTPVILGRLLGLSAVKLCRCDRG